jgi:phosphoglycerate dehydrogenase-like enzyme
MKLVLGTDEGETFFSLLDDVDGVTAVRAKSNEDQLREIVDADAFYGRITPELLAAARNLKWVQSQSAGVDFLMSFPDLVESDIVITNTRGAHAPSIAEHTFALLLSMTRKIPKCLDWQHQRYWARAEGYRLPTELMGSTMGIVGYGQIGRAVAKRAVAFDMRVVAVDVQEVPGDDVVPEVWPIKRLPDLLATSNVLVVAAPFTVETRHMIDAEALVTMPKGSYLVAVSRGGIVNESALAEALNSGHLAGAGIDVAEIEPLDSDSPLWDLDNIILTHHTAGSSWQKERRCVEILVDNVKRFQRGDELTNLVDKRAGY